MNLVSGYERMWICLPWVAPGSADAPRHQLRADLEVLLIEGYAGIEILTTWGTMQPKVGDQLGEEANVSSGRERSCLKYGSLRPPFCLKGRACEFMRLMYDQLARVPRLRLSSLGKDRCIDSCDRSGTTLRGVFLVSFGMPVGLPVCWAFKKQKSNVRSCCNVCRCSDLKHCQK